jgi:hypothetical protein
MRRLRLLGHNVWYEIRTDINNREALFRRPKALAIFSRVFRETMGRFVFTIRNVKLEDDRLIFYIKPGDGFELPAIMKWMKQVFAQRYNAAAGRVGHIWGDRYWSRIVEGEPEVGSEGGVGENSANGDRLRGGDRPHRREAEGKPVFSFISPFPLFPSPG